MPDQIALARLPEFPSTMRPLTDHESRWLAEQHPRLPDTPRQGCVTCNVEKRPSGRFRWYAPGSRTEVVEYECPCDDQYLGHRRMLYSGIGLLYQRVDLLDFYELPDDKAELMAEYVGNLDAYLSAGVNIVLHGATRGTGKSMLMYLIMKRAIARGVDTYAVTFADLMGAYTAGFRSPADRERFHVRVRNTQLLGVDDLGREYAGLKDLNENTLEAVLRFRTQQGLPTFFSSNLSEREMAEGYGGHTWSVFSERTIFSEWIGADLRPRAKARTLAEIRQRITRPVLVEL